MPEESNDKPYSNREIREKWHDITDGLQKILIQTQTTNGRVKDLELSRARQEGFNKALAIFAAAAWALCFAFTSWVAMQIIEAGQEIQKLNSKLSAYEINVEK